MTCSPAVFDWLGGVASAAAVVALIASAHQRFIRWLQTDAIVSPTTRQSLTSTGCMVAYCLWLYLPTHTLNPTLNGISLICGVILMYGLMVPMCVMMGGTFARRRNSNVD